MENKYLPIGSVCTLKGKSRKVMITGYYSVKFNGNLKINDYKGCVYPEGLLISDQTISFNHTDIENIDFIGFKNEEQEKFMKLFDRLTGNISDEDKAKEFHENNEMFLTSNSTYSKLLFDENGVVMIAESVPEQSKLQSKGVFSNIKFDENGTVISVEDNVNVKNPFYIEYKPNNEPEKKYNSLNIFNNIEFDENGTVVSVDENKKDAMLSKIEFDENGTVISVSGDDLKNKENYNQYKFDENGVLISDGDNSLEQKTETSLSQSNEYKFAEDGTVLAELNQTSENIKFDENGVVVSA